MTWVPPTFVDKEDGGTTQHLDAATLNGMVGAISTALSAGSSGVVLPWATATAYVTGQPVTNGGKTWLAVDNHTAGATFSGDSAHWTQLPTGSSGLVPTAVKTANYTAVSGDLVRVDTTSGAITVTLPAAAAGATVGVKLTTLGGTNAVTIAAAGSDVFNKAGGATTLTLSLLNQGVVLAAISGVWVVQADDLALTQLDARFRPTSGLLSARPTATGSQALYYSTDIGRLDVDQAAGVWGPAVRTLADDPVYSTHNLTPSSLKFSKAALARCRAGLDDFRIAVQGDSIVNGGIATTPLTDNFVRRAATILGAKVGVGVRRGLIPISTYGAIDAQWTVGSGWAAWGDVVYATSKAYTAAAGNTPTLDFTPTDDAGTAIQAESFKIYLWVQSGVGSIQWAIDGGSYTTLTTSSPGYNGIAAFTVSAGSRGLHTLHIKALATGSAPIVLGAEAVDSQNYGIRYAWGGSNGATTPTGLTTGSSGVATFLAFQPDLLINEWNTNEYGQQIALATFQTNVQTVAANAASLFTGANQADLLWLAAIPSGGGGTIPQSAYYATLDAAADAAGFPVLHLDRQFVSYAVANAVPLSLMADQIHPNTAGHNFVGASIASLLAVL